MCECVYTYIGQVNPFDNHEHFTTQEDMYVYQHSYFSQSFVSFYLWSTKDFICTSEVAYIIILHVINGC